MVNGSAASIPGGLIVDVESSGPYRKEYVSRAGEPVAKTDLSAQMPAPPLDRRVDVGRKYMRMIDMVHCFFDLGVVASPATCCGAYFAPEDAPNKY